MWPQYTYITLMVISLFIVALVHGEPRKGKQSFPIAFMSSLIAIFILLCGGFFNPLIEAYLGK